jgi:hypothetical protein
MTRSLLTAVSLALAGCTLAGCIDTGTPDRVSIAGDTSATGIPLEWAGPGDAAVVVPVHLNGQGPYDFVLDTGATLTCVDAALADSLGLEEATGRIGRGVGIGGQPGGMRLVALDSMRIGDATASGLTACAVNLEAFRAAGVDLHGLVGLNFLSAFRVTLDFQAGRLTLERP